jgi:hypothetical protein
MEVLVEFLKKLRSIVAFPERRMVQLKPQPVRLTVPKRNR